MDAFCKRFLLMLAVFSMVILLDACIVFCASKPSQKVKVEEACAGTTESSSTSRILSLSSRGVMPPIGDWDVDSILSYAKKFIGIKYRYGASGPESFDCSGFTMHVMGKYGIELPHSAKGQSEHGILVSVEDLMPGDMVYFDTTKKKRGISHVGIYLGFGKFIHASLKGVRISSLEEEYYSKRYVMATRLVR